MEKYIPKENDIEITGDWLTENGFDVIDFNTYKKDYLVLVATRFNKTHRNKGVLFFHQKVVLNGHTFNHGRALRYISQIPVLPELETNNILYKIKSLRKWVDTELRLDGYEHNNILLKIDEILNAHQSA